jgi:hypothetical protein
MMVGTDAATCSIEWLAAREVLRVSDAQAEVVTPGMPLPDRSQEEHRDEKSAQDRSV